MTVTIDKAGRVVIPAELRARYDLKPGTRLELVSEEFGIRLVRTVSRPRLVMVGKLLVARPTVPARELPAVDVPALVERERDRWP
jgi:AbrB family looped-hinge helix DNA binding protein